MKAVTWQGKYDIPVKDVRDPKIQEPRDIILRLTTTAICGSDLHIYDGYIPMMEKNDILGHEFMGIVEETGPNHSLKKGLGSHPIPHFMRRLPFVQANGNCPLRHDEFGRRGKDVKSFMARRRPVFVAIPVSTAATVHLVNLISQ